MGFDIRYDLTYLSVPELAEVYLIQPVEAQRVGDPACRHLLYHRRADSPRPSYAITQPDMCQLVPV